MFGGGQENGRRAGTENVASIVAFGKAAECAALRWKMKPLASARCEIDLKTAVLERVPDSFVNGDRNVRLPNTSNLSFAGVESGAALAMLDRQKICCSAGSACNTGSIESSHVLRAMKSDGRASAAACVFPSGASTPRRKSIARSRFYRPSFPNCGVCRPRRRCEKRSLPFNGRRVPARRAWPAVRSPRPPARLSCPAYRSPGRPGVPRSAADPPGLTRSRR